MLFPDEPELQFVGVIHNDPQLSKLRSHSFIDELRVGFVEVDMLLFLHATVGEWFFLFLSGSGVSGAFHLIYLGGTSLVLDHS